MLIQALEHGDPAGQVDLLGGQGQGVGVRQPVACSTPQKVRTSRGARAAAAKKARRSSSVK
jgi:hypothetical protein